MEEETKKCEVLYSEHERELIELILGIKDDPNRKSTLQLALESARFHCGIGKDRIIDNATFSFRQDFLNKIYNGEYRHSISDDADIFTSLLSYFICLEQIGEVFYTEENRKKGETNGIVNAISLFSPVSISKEKMIALKNLRNSLGHAYGLININKAQKRGTNKYILDFRNENEDIITIPSKKKTWDGNFLDKKDETSTTIYVFPLIRFIENIIQNVIEEYNKGKLRFIFYEEIKARFTIIHDNNQQDNEK